MQSLCRINRPVSRLFFQSSRSGGVATWKTSPNRTSITMQRSTSSLRNQSGTPPGFHKAFFIANEEDALIPDEPPPSLLDAPDDHGIAHLKKPWRPSDLPSAERYAYVKFGPDYLQHLTAQARQHATERAQRRDRIVTRFGKKLGSDWYSIFVDAKKLREERLPVGHVQRQADRFTRYMVLLRKGATLDGATAIDVEARECVDEYRLLRKLSSAPLQPFIREVFESRKATHLSDKPETNNNAKTEAQAKNSDKPETNNNAETEAQAKNSDKPETNNNAETEAQAKKTE